MEKKEQISSSGESADLSSNPSVFAKWVLNELISPHIRDIAKADRMRNASSSTTQGQPRMAGAILKFHHQQFPNLNDICLHLIFQSRRFERFKPHFFCDDDSRASLSILISLVHFISASPIGAKVIFQTKWVLRKFVKMLGAHQADRSDVRICWVKHMLAETFYNLSEFYMKGNDEKWVELGEEGITALCKALFEEQWSYNMPATAGVCHTDLRDLSRTLTSALFTNSEEVRELILRTAKPLLTTWINRLPKQVDISGGYTGGAEMALFVILFLELVVHFDNECAGIIKETKIVDLVISLKKSGDFDEAAEFLEMLKNPKKFGMDFEGRKEVLQGAILAAGKVKCGALDCENWETLKSCGGCLVVSYCSQQCQTSHWKDHKKLCRML